jgi:hypothetical protein
LQQDSLLPHGQGQPGLERVEGLASRRMLAIDPPRRLERGPPWHDTTPLEEHRAEPEEILGFQAVVIKTSINRKCRVESTIPNRFSRRDPPGFERSASRGLRRA